MNFLNPALFAAGMFAVAIPIIIHLLMRRRRKPVMWGAMRFVLEAYRRTRRRLLIERWLLLAARCVLIALIALALGRPLLQGSGGGIAGMRTVYILLDNSLTSGAAESGQTSLARNKAAARALISSLADGDRVGVVLAGGPAQGLVSPPSSDLRAVRELIDAAESVDSRADWSGAVALAGSAINDARAALHRSGGDGREMVVLLSDFLTGSVDLERAIPRLPGGVRLVATQPADHGVDNVSLVRIVPQRQVLISSDPGQGQTVTVDLARSGPSVGQATTTNVHVRLQSVDDAGGAARPAQASGGTAAVRWSPGERTASVTMAIDSPAKGVGASLVVAELDADPLKADNSWRLPIETRDALRVGLAADAPLRAASRTADALRPAEWLALALRPSEAAPVELVEIDPGSIDGPRLAGLDALFLPAPHRVTDEGWQRIGQWIRAGGLLMLMPPPDQVVHAWADSMTRAFNAPWQLARQAVKVEPPGGRISGEPAAQPGSAGDVLAALRGELPELVQPVGVVQYLPLKPEEAGGASPAAGAVKRGELLPVLKLEDGTPLLWFATLGADERSPSANPAGAAGVSPESPRSAASSAPGSVGSPSDQPDRSGQRGAILYLATALNLDWSDLPAKPLVVPMMQELLKQGVGRARPAVWSVAGHAVRTPQQTAELRGQRPADGGPAPLITVGLSGEPSQPIRSAGVWQATDALGGARGVLTINPDPAASATDTSDPQALLKWIESALPEGAAEKLQWFRPGGAAMNAGAGAAEPAVGVVELLNTKQGGVPMGTTLLFVAVAVGLLEVFLARRSSHTGSGSMMAAPLAAGALGGAA